MSYLAIDPGMGNIKVVGRKGSVVVQSNVATNGGGRVTSTAGVGVASKPDVVSMPQGRYYVGNNAHAWGRPVESFDSSKLEEGSPELRALVYAAIARYLDLPGEGDKFEEKFTVVVGIPNDMLTENAAGGGVQEKIQNTKNWLNGEHQWDVDDKPYAVKVGKVLVTSQAAGGLFDYVLNDAGDMSREPAHIAALKGRVGIISLGFKTAEFLVLDQRQIYPGMTGNTTSGVRRMLELLDPAKNFSLADLDSRLRAGRLPFKPALPGWATEVKGDIESLWRTSWKGFEKVLVFGGGAALLRPKLALYFQGKMWMPDDPIMGIARGLYKAGKTLEKGAKEK